MSGSSGRSCAASTAAARGRRGTRRCGRAGARRAWPAWARARWRRRGIPSDSSLASVSSNFSVGNTCAADVAPVAGRVDEGVRHGAGMVTSSAGPCQGTSLDGNRAPAGVAMDRAPNHCTPVPAPDALRDSRRAPGPAALADGGAAMLSSSHVCRHPEAFVRPGWRSCMAAGARASPAPHWGPAGFAPSPLERGSSRSPRPSPTSDEVHVKLALACRCGARPRGRPRRCPSRPRPATAAVLHSSATQVQLRARLDSLARAAAATTPLEARVGVALPRREAGRGGQRDSAIACFQRALDLRGDHEDRLSLTDRCCCRHHGRDATTALGVLKTGIANTAGREAASWRSPTRRAAVGRRSSPATPRRRSCSSSRSSRGWRRAHAGVALSPRARDARGRRSAPRLTTCSCRCSSRRGTRTRSWWRCSTRSAPRRAAAPRSTATSRVISARARPDQRTAITSMGGRRVTFPASDGSYLGECSSPTRARPSAAPRSILVAPWRHDRRLRHAERLAQARGFRRDARRRARFRRLRVTGMLAPRHLGGAPASPRGARGARRPRRAARTAHDVFGRRHARHRDQDRHDQRRSSSGRRDRAAHRAAARARRSPSVPEVERVGRCWRACGACSARRSFRSGRRISWRRAR